VALGGGVAFRVTQLEAVTGLVGISLGCCFPLMVTLAGQYFPRRRGTAVGLVAGLGSQGGFVVPWLLGFAGNRLGIVFVMGSLALGCALIAAGGSWLARLADREA